MRTWISFRTPIRGIRVGAGASLPAARVYPVSATGQKVLRGGSALMLIGLVSWLIASRDQDGRLNENFLMAIILAYAAWRTFGLVVAAIFPPEQRGDGPS
jgi:hypothetical protein